MSDLHLAAMGKDRDWAGRQLDYCGAIARRRFDFVSIGAQDASRASAEFVFDCAQIADSLGVDRFRLADTVGILDPEQTANLVSRIVAGVGDSIAIGFHAHNDLGMATANTLAAAKAGARHLDVTVAGLGERAGNAALEQVVMAIRTAWQHDLGIDTTRFREITHLVTSAADRKIPSNQPIVGSDVFSHESGIHVRGMIADERTYQPFKPQQVGHAPARFILGKHSGRTARLLLAQSNGVERTLHGELIHD
jgi:homocitrate synthase NifV